MTTERPRSTSGGWVLAAVFVACALASAERLAEALFIDDEPVAWAQVVRIASCVLALVTAIGGAALVLRGHHRRTSVSRFGDVGDASLPDDSPDPERQTRIARAVARAFPLTMCLLLLAFAVATYVATFPDEPAFVRVLSTTAALIAALWSLGAVTTRVRASRRLRDRE